MPEGRRAGRIRLLAAAANPQVDHSGRYVTVTVPSIVDHEVVAVDWG
jgi:hypothetical protein